MNKLQTQYTYCIMFDITTCNKKMRTYFSRSVNKLMVVKSPESTKNVSTVIIPADKMMLALLSMN